MHRASFRAVALGRFGLAVGCLMAAPALHGQELVPMPGGSGFLIYGNYCGPGNRGPRFRPVDALDQACAHHDACWPSAPAALPTCACNARLHTEAGLVARDPRAPARTRETARFISDVAAAIPCEDPDGGPGPSLPGFPRRSEAR